MMMMMIIWLIWSLVETAIVKSGFMKEDVFKLECDGFNKKSKKPVIHTSRFWQKMRFLPPQYTFLAQKGQDRSETTQSSFATCVLQIYLSNCLTFVPRFKLPSTEPGHTVDGQGQCLEPVFFIWGSFGLNRFGGIYISDPQGKISGRITWNLHDFLFLECIVERSCHHIREGMT